MSQTSSSSQIPYKVTETSDGHARTIQIASWNITATSTTISNAAEIDEAQESLNGLPLPEMPFGNNLLDLHHEPTGWRYRFNLLDALAEVRMGEPLKGDGVVKVGYAKEWMQSRSKPDSETPMPQTSPTKNYDWTYTTTYSGSVAPDSPHWLTFGPGDPTNPAHRIPYDQLTRQDPILFYSEIPLFEDELHDNGASLLIVRIRVMPTCFFILSRFTLRVDNVLFRTFDTRIFHSFEKAATGAPVVVRETSGWEAPYAAVKQFLPDKNDLSPLTDPAFIAKTLSAFPKSVGQNPEAPDGTGWKGLETTNDCCLLVMASSVPT